MFYYDYFQIREKGEISFDLHLPEGEYAISLYHDINGDSKLNRRIYGAPGEPYGFSNNVRRTFRAPEYSQAALEVRKDMKIFIRIQ